MAQPIRKSIKNPPKPRKKETTRIGRIKQVRARAKGNQEYGTSKLEEKFAREFLDKLGIEYVYQYKMGSIKRYLDFFLPEYRIGIEVDGDFYHSYGILYEDMSPMQKRNHRVDEIKNKWCSRNGIPLIRIWEHDIHKNPKMVMDYLKEVLRIHENRRGK